MLTYPKTRNLLRNGCVSLLAKISEGMHVLRCLAAKVVGVCLIFGVAQAHSIQRNPLSYISTVDEPAINTPSHRVHSLSSFDLTFHLHNKKQRLKLKVSPNHDVIGEGATVQYLAADGTVRSTEAIDRSEHRVFMGDTWMQNSEGAEWTNVGWARIVVHQDGIKPVFEGAFRVDGNHHHIQTRSNYLQTKRPEDPKVADTAEESMIVWRDSDVVQDAPEELRRDLVHETSCMADGLTFNVQPEHPVYAGMRKRNPVEIEQETGFWGSLSSRSLLFGRQIDGTTGGNSAGVNLSSTIGNTNGCPSMRKVALIGMATDCTYTASFNSTAAARANIINQVNTASVQYEDAFNISLGIQNLTISDAVCPGTPAATAPWNVPCSSDVTIQDRLNLFSAWSGNRTGTNAWWTLLSTCPTGQAIGLAWLGQACVTGSTSNVNETVAAANVIVKTSQEWQVIAHESGHTLGAVHDCTKNSCADGQTVASQQCCPLSSTTCDANGRFIMNPASVPGSDKFSACSIGNICSALGRNSVKSSCLVPNRGVTTISGSQCGNGIVEAGEECDCGGPSGCGSNSCCNPTTCKLTTNSQCDPSNEDCCTSTCKFAASGTVCRESTGICDPQETCSGTNATCPADQTAADGTSCGNSTESLTCSSGQCTSRDLQCKTIMGSYTQGNDTYACDQSSCSISCASPQFGFNRCYGMKQNFLDGTSCDGGGKCSNGACQGSTVGGQIVSWIDQNKTLVIALAAGLGGLFLLSVLCCFISCFRRRRRARKMPPRPPPGWAGPPAAMRYRDVYGGAPIPRPPQMRNSQRWRGYEHPPPPVYMNGSSVRYA